MKIIDGSYGEGGGQILRTSVALACITGEDIRVINIRAKRPNPGLKRQHITAIRAAAELCRADVEGLELGSKEITFKPGGIVGGSYRFDIGTAGSVTLVLQTLLPIMLYSPTMVSVELRGGTDVPWSPPIDYFRNVIVWHVSRLSNADVRVHLLRRGHYPRGGGVVRVEVLNPPRELSNLTLVRRGEIKWIKGRSHCVRLPRHVAERQANSARNELLREGLKAPINIEIEWYEQGKDPHLGPGSGIVLWSYCGNTVLGSDSLGARGKRAEVVGAEAARKLIKELRTGMALDTHMSDNIVPYIALAKGESVVGCSEMTMHAYTNIWLIRKLLSIEVITEGELGKPFILKVKGASIRF